MSLIGRLVNKLLKAGSITLLLPGKPPRTYGPGGGQHLTIRFTDRKVAFDIATNPRLRLGEAYMDGRLVIEDGTILDLLEMVTGSNRWEDGVLATIRWYAEHRERWLGRVDWLPTGSPVAGS